MKAHIRWMIRRDMLEVLEIESSYGDWSEDTFLECLRARNVIGMVAEQDEKVVGFMIYELHKHRIEVLKLAVHPNSRRKSVGSQMASKIISKLSSHRRTLVTIQVKDDNLAAHLFLKRNSLKAVQTLRTSDGDFYKFDFAIPGMVFEEDYDAVCE